MQPPSCGARAVLEPLARPRRRWFGAGLSLPWRLVDLNVPEMNGELKNPTAAEQRGAGCELLPPQRGEKRELVLFQLCEAAVLSLWK